MGTLSRLPVRLLAMVLLMTLLPQAAAAQNGPPPRAEITTFDCSGHIEAYVPYDRSDQDPFVYFEVFTPDRSWSYRWQLENRGPGVYDLQFRLPSDRDSFTAMIRVPYPVFMIDIDTMTISGCAGGPTIPGLDPGADYDVVAQIVAVLISILSAMLGGD